VCTKVRGSQLQLDDLQQRDYRGDGGTRTPAQERVHAGAGEGAHRRRRGHAGQGYVDAGLCSRACAQRSSRRPLSLLPLPPAGQQARKSTEKLRGGKLDIHLLLSRSIAGKETQTHGPRRTARATPPLTVSAPTRGSRASTKGEASAVTRSGHRLRAVAGARPRDACSRRRVRRRARDCRARRASRPPATGLRPTGPRG
jgi:hypothetical protein